MSERTQVQITRTDLTKKVQEGWKKDALAEHYGVPVLRMGEILKGWNLRIRSHKGPSVLLIDDTVNNEQEIVQETVEETLIINTEVNSVEEGETITQNNDVVEEKGLF